MSGVSHRADEDTAAVIAVIAALASTADVGGGEADSAPRSVWADHPHAFRVRHPSATGWWASGLPR